jgi:YVTN family beta-propeller protein
MSLPGSGILRMLLVLFVAAAATLVWAFYLRIPTNVAYVSEENGGISIFDLKKFVVTRRIRSPNISPRGLAVTPDGKYLVVANKNTSDVAIFSTPRLRLVRRIHVGDNPEFVKIDPTGEWLFTSHEPGSKGGPPSTGDDQDQNGPPSEVVTFHIPDWTPGPTFTAGPETEGLEFSRDGKILIVANEAQDTLGLYDAHSGALVRDIDLKSYGIRPRGVKVSPQGDSYAVTMEASGTLLTLDRNFNVTRSVVSGAKPYGVAFDRDGRHIFVAAATAQLLQVFATDSLQLVAQIPIGKRCWHFTFTPDDSKLLLACGRSDSIYVIDANSYKVLAIISGFDLPWGIVTFPKAYGSLGLP